MRSFLFNSKATRLRGVVCLAACGVALSWPGVAQAQEAPPEPVDPDAVESPEADVDAPAADTPSPEPGDVEPTTVEDENENDQAALGSELASARRLGAELDALLRPDGQLDTAQGADALVRLAGLATRCGILANSAMHDEVRLVLLGCQARALGVLACLEPVGRGAARRATNRAEELGRVAEQIGALDAPGAASAGDYWSLLAGLAPQAGPDHTPTRRQARAEQALSAYIEAYQQVDLAHEYVLDARLSLAQLMDQRGAQRDAVKQLNLIGKLPPGSPRLHDAKRLRESIARLGRAIGIESLSTQLVVWRSSDHLGKPVLVHVYADSVEPSVRVIDRISRAIVEGSISGIAVVSLRVGEPIAGTASPPWPTLPIQLEADGVLERLGVTVLPTLAWLDDQGRLASIGHTPAVLDQLQSLLPKDEDAGSDEGPGVEGEDVEPGIDGREDSADEVPALEDAPAESSAADQALDESSPTPIDPADLDGAGDVKP